jgi:CrcB protein
MMDRDRLVNLALVGAGGVLGTALRVGLAEMFPRPQGAFPTTTLLVNWSGCLALGLLFALIEGDAAPARRWRALVGIGVLGAYTTFSTFALEVNRLVESGRAGLSFTYVLTSVMGGVALAGVGAWCGQRLRRAPA